MIELQSQEQDRRERLSSPLSRQLGKSADLVPFTLPVCLHSACVGHNLGVESGVMTSLPANASAAAVLTVAGLAG